MWEMIMITVFAMFPDKSFPADAKSQGVYASKADCEEAMMGRYAAAYTTDDRGTIERENGDLVFFYKGWDYHNTLRCIEISR